MKIRILQDTIDILRKKKKLFKNPQTKGKKVDTKIVHIMFNDKFNKPFVDFLNKNFNPKEHLILCKKALKESASNPFPVGNNVVEFQNINDFDFKSKKVEKIIFHSLFIPETIERLYNEPELLEKSYWVMWGGDLYQAPRDEKNDFVRKNFKGYLGDIDKNYAIKKYTIEAAFYKNNYPLLISKEMLDNTKKNDSDSVKIQINNSCDETILEMFDVLAKFKDENIKITTILSYGHPELKSKIIEKGKNIFGEKFEYIAEFMPPQEYAQHLANNDILILNQKRQQGLGNTLVSLYLGQKVFIREKISVNDYLNNKGIKIFNTQDISNMDFKTFIYYNENEKENTIKNVSEYFDEKEIIVQWEEVFNAE